MSFKRFVAQSLLSIAALCLLAASVASAATLNVVGGQLMGAFSYEFLRDPQVRPGAVKFRHDPTISAAW